MKVWISLREIYCLLGLTRQSVDSRAKRERWERRKERGCNGGDRYVYSVRGLPLEVQAAYARSLGVEMEVLTARLNKPSGKGLKGVKRLFKDYDGASEEERTLARLRARIVRSFAEAKAAGMGLVKFCELYNKGLMSPETREELSGFEPRELTKSRLAEYARRYDAYGLSGLVPQYHKRGGAGAGLPKEIVERIEWLYLDSSKPSVPAVFRAVQQYLPAGVAASLPTVRRVVDGIPPAARDYFRKGAGYFEKAYLAYIERDYTRFAPMEAIVGDYVTLDFLARVDGHLWRPKLCAFMDMRTRAIVGWSLQLTANSTGVILALKTCFEKYGLPGTIYFDNGKEFKNYQLCGNEWKIRRSLVDAEDVERDVGIVVEAGVNISFCQPYHGQSKPIERFWRTLHNEFDKGFLTYYGSNTAERPDEVRLYYHNVKGIKKRDINEAVDFATAERLLENHFRHYNERWEHTGAGMDGRAPLAVWAGYAYPGMSQQKLLSELAGALGLERKGGTSALIDRIVEELRGRDIVAVVDQADYLTDASLELLRCVVVDMGEAGLALVGLPRLDGRLRSLKNDHDQLLSRVGGALKVGGMKAEDAELIARGVWADVGEDALAEFIKEARGSVRALVNLIKLTHRVCAVNGLDAPTADAVREAAGATAAR